MLTLLLMISAVSYSPQDNREIESLLSETADGNNSSFSVLYDKTKKSVYSYAYSILKNSYDAEDVMHEAYITIYKNASSYNPHGKPMAWIFTIVRNLALMEFRRKKRKDGDELDINEKDSSQSHTQEVENKDLIFTVLEKLNDTERQIVVLHAVSGVKHRDIAQLLDIPLSTVLSKYTRALAKMKNILSEVDSQ